MCASVDCSENEKNAKLFGFSNKKKSEKTAFWVKKIFGRCVEARKKLKTQKIQSNIQQKTYFKQFFGVLPWI